jgi:hypothetical protein
MALKAQYIFNQNLEVQDEIDGAPGLGTISAFAPAPSGSGRPGRQAILNGQPASLLNVDTEQFRLKVGSSVSFNIRVGTAKEGAIIMALFDGTYAAPNNGWMVYISGGKVKFECYSGGTKVVNAELGSVSTALQHWVLVRESTGIKVYLNKYLLTEIALNDSVNIDPTPTPSLNLDYTDPYNSGSQRYTQQYGIYTHEWSDSSAAFSNPNGLGGRIRSFGTTLEIDLYPLGGYALKCARVYFNNLAAFVAAAGLATTPIIEDYSWSTNLEGVITDQSNVTRGSLLQQVANYTGATVSAGVFQMQLPNTVASAAGNFLRLSLRIGPQPTVVQLATGGTVSFIRNSDGTYDEIHKFTSSGNLVFSEMPTSAGRLMIVGGGGGGGHDQGGGGGGGEVLINDSFTFSDTTNSVTIGAGGNAGTGQGAGSNGADSVFGSYTAYGGNGGGGFLSSVPSARGSGGGGAQQRVGGTASKHSYAGFTSYANNGATGLADNMGGGGGGAGAAATGRIGADGVDSDISGTTAKYGAGGGGGMAQNSSNYSDGGQGGGGRGGYFTTPNNQGTWVSPVAGTANTGSGSGGNVQWGQAPQGKPGGSGVVYCRFRTRFIPPPDPPILSQIGSLVETPSLNLDASYMDVRYYDNALTAQEVSDMYTLTYFITVIGDSHVTINPAGPTVTVPEGADQTFFFTPAPDYLIADALVDGVRISKSEIDAGTYTFSNVIADHTIEIRSCMQVILPEADSYAIPPLGLSLDFQPAANYHYLKAEDDRYGEITDDPYSLAFDDENHRMTVYFEEDSWIKLLVKDQSTVNLTGNGHTYNNIVVDAANYYETTGNVTVGVTADIGYYITNVWLYETLYSVNSGSFSGVLPIETNHDRKTISVSTKALPTITVNSIPPTHGTITGGGQIASYGMTQCLNISYEVGWVVDLLITWVETGEVLELNGFDGPTYCLTNITGDIVVQGTWKRAPGTGGRFIRMDGV